MWSPVIAKDFLYGEREFQNDHDETAIAVIRK